MCKNFLFSLCAELITTSSILYGDKKWIVENTTMFPIGIYRVDNWCGFPTFLGPLAVLVTIIHGWKRMMRMMRMMHTQVQSWILIEISIANPRFKYTWKGKIFGAANALFHSLDLNSHEHLYNRWLRKLQTWLRGLLLVVGKRVVENFDSTATSVTWMGIERKASWAAGDMIVPVGNLSPLFSCRDLFTQLLMIVDTHAQWLLQILNLYLTSHCTTDGLTCLRNICIIGYV
jgi:hypothetical protein